MAQYLILIFQAESADATVPPEVWQQATEAHGR